MKLYNNNFLKVVRIKKKKFLCFLNKYAHMQRELPRYKPTVKATDRNDSNVTFFMKWMKTRFRMRKFNPYDLLSVV